MEWIALVRGTPSIGLVAVAQVASCFGRAFIHPEDEIVVTEIEHHSNLVPWQMLCKERGAHLRICRVTDKVPLRLPRPSYCHQPRDGEGLEDWGT